MLPLSSFHGASTLRARVHANRFLVLEHSVLLVYASEEDWAEHREPLDDMTLSHDSSVELAPEGGEVCTLCSNAAMAAGMQFLFSSDNTKNAKIQKHTHKKCFSNQGKISNMLRILHIYIWPPVCHIHQSLRYYDAILF